MKIKTLGMNLRVLVFLLNTLIVLPASAQEQDGLLVNVNGDWEPAAFSNEQLNKPGMLCIRYNNFWCVKGSDVDPWVGQAGLDKRKHAIFENSAYGARAFFIIMRTYHHKHGLRTSRQIFSRYAPADDCIGSLPRIAATGKCPQGENPTLLYARRVAKMLNVGIDDDIGLFDNDGRADFDVAIELAKGVVQFELGPRRLVTVELVRSGLNLAGIEVQ